MCSCSPDSNSSPLAAPLLTTDLAQASIATATLAASAVQAARLARPPTSTPRTRVIMPHASAAFVSERLLRIDGHPPPPEWGVIGGLYATSDGWVRVHDSFAHHRTRLVGLLGCEENKTAVGEAIGKWGKVELEVAALQAGAVVYALRSEEEWDALPQVRLCVEF